MKKIKHTLAVIFLSVVFIGGGTVIVLELFGNKSKEVATSPQPIKKEIEKQKSPDKVELEPLKDGEIDVSEVFLPKNDALTYELISTDQTVSLGHKVILIEPNKIGIEVNRNLGNIQKENSMAIYELRNDGIYLIERDKKQENVIEFPRKIKADQSLKVGWRTWRIVSAKFLDVDFGLCVLGEYPEDMVSGYELYCKGIGLIEQKIGKSHYRMHSNSFQKLKEIVKKENRSVASSSAETKITLTESEKKCLDLKDKFSFCSKFARIKAVEARPSLLNGYSLKNWLVKEEMELEQISENIVNSGRNKIEKQSCILKTIEANGAPFIVSGSPTQEEVDMACKK